MTLLSPRARIVTPSLFLALVGLAACGGVVSDLGDGRSNLSAAEAGGSAGQAGNGGDYGAAGRGGDAGRDGQLADGGAGHGAGGSATAGTGGSGAGGSATAGTGGSGAGGSAPAVAGAGGTPDPGALPPDVACWQGSVPVYVASLPPFDVTSEVGPVTPAPCSLVGTWDVVPSSVPYAAVPRYYSFDDQGRFVSGAPGADPCGGHDLSGSFISYAQLLWMSHFEGGGLLSCAYDQGYAGYLPSFSADCSRVSLTVKWDSCTGAGVLRDGGDLQRRQ